jgi:hypothetical protein
LFLFFQRLGERYKVPRFAGDEEMDRWSDALSNELGRSGYEVRRTGGACGAATPNDDWAACLREYKGILPRHSSSAIWVPMGNSWKVFYISPYQGTDSLVAVCCRYGQPFKGGQFDVSETLFEEHPEYFDRCVSLQSLMAPLLLAVKTSTGISAVPQAIKLQLAHNSYAHDDGVLSPDLARLRLLSLSSWTKLECTVSAHVDTMKQSIPSPLSKLKKKIALLKKNKKSRQAQQLEEQIYVFSEEIVKCTSFFETITIFLCPKKSNMCSRVALMRGGAGAGGAVFATTSHPRKAGGTHANPDQIRQARERGERATLRNQQRNGDPIVATL